MSEKSSAVIIGASSGVGRAMAEALATKSYNLILSARDERDLEALGNDLSIKFNIHASSLSIDLTGPVNFEAYADQCIKVLQEIDVVMIPAGMITEGQEDALKQPDMEALVKANYLSVIQLVAAFLKYFKKRGSGKIVVCSSIAVAAPWKRNMVYASTKSALETYCKGLQHVLSSSDIQVQVYALGYVDTAMTFGEKKLFPVASPEAVAAYVIKNLDKKIRFRYYPRFWAIIVFVLRNLPWFIYKRLSF